MNNILVILIFSCYFNDEFPCLNNTIYILKYFITFELRLFLEEYDRKGLHIKNQNIALGITLER